MRLCVYSHSIAPSIDGVCRRFTGLLHEMVRQGHEVLLFTIEDAPEDLPAGLNEVVPLLHMVVPAYPDKKIGRPAAVNLTRIYSGVARHRPDVIHITNDALSNTFALVGLLLGVPVVGSFHTDLQDLLSSHKAHPLQSILTWAKERFDYEVLDSCGTTSVSFQHKLAAQGIQCEYVIKTAVDKAVFHPGRRSAALRRELCFGDDSAFLCVYVGRLSREKRLDVIISALRDLPHAYLAIVGDGPSAATYGELHGSSTRIYCRPGFKSHAELAEVYASCDLHLSASEFETLGNTVLEAHSCGIPVVVPRTQGFMDTVTDSSDGFFFAPGDSASARERIAQLMGDRELCRKMGLRGLTAVSDRAISSVVDGLLRWYARGRENRARAFPVSKALRMALLFAGTPVTIAVLSLYDLLMFVILGLGFELHKKSKS